MATYPNHSLSLVPSGILPGPIQSVGRVGQQGPPPQQAAVRKHRHDDEEQGKLFVGGLRYEKIVKKLSFLFCFHTLTFLEILHFGKIKYEGYDAKL